jgi:hypothetical protein
VQNHKRMYEYYINMSFIYYYFNQAVSAPDSRQCGGRKSCKNKLLDISNSYAECASSCGK